MNTCPMCHQPMTEGYWTAELPLIQLYGGGAIRIAPGSLPASTVCCNCSLIWVPPAELAAPAEVQLSGTVCPACGKKMPEGSFADKLPEFVTTEGRTIKISVAGTLLCTACPHCGLIHVPQKRLLPQSAAEEIAEIRIKGRARAERIITRCMGGGALLGAAAGFIVESGLEGAAMGTYAPGAYPVPRMYGRPSGLGILIGGALGFIIGAAVGAIAVARLGLPRPWRKD